MSSGGGGLDAFNLPPEDRTGAPFTGWTRTHWTQVADTLLDAVGRHVTPKGAGIKLPGRASNAGPASDHLEGFARSFVLAAYRLAGGNGRAQGRLIERYAEGLAAGTDPAGEEAWTSPSVGQSTVESALIAIALYETRPCIWDELPDRTQQRIVAWLAACARRRTPISNWALFPVVVESFLASVGAPTPGATIDDQLDLLDMLYRGEGWYSDGLTPRYDHYCGWAMHFYSGYWARMQGPSADPERVATVRRRLERFLEDYRLLFGADGAPLHHGRSLIYRFAVLAPFWMGVLEGATPLSPGETRRLASGTLRYFIEGGATREGLLTLGWQAARPEMTQSYSGPGSPYWASIGFAGLLLPDEHPVWSTPEEPLPVERGGFSRLLRTPGLLAWSDGKDGIVRAAMRVAGTDDPGYRKLTYGTATGPGLGTEDADAQVRVVTGDRVVPRRAPVALEGCDWAVASRFAVGEWSIAPRRWLPARAAHRLCGWLDRRVLGSRPLATRLVRYSEVASVETVSVAVGRVELRIHHVSCAAPCGVLDGGAAIAGDRGPMGRTDGAFAEARSAQLVSRSIGLHGYRSGEVLAGRRDNAFGACSATPVLHAGLERSGGMLVSLHLVAPVSSGGGVDTAPVKDVRVEERQVWFADQNGAEYFVQLAGPGEATALQGRPIPEGTRFARVTPGGGLEAAPFA